MLSKQGSNDAARCLKTGKCESEEVSGPEAHARMFSVCWDDWELGRVEEFVQ